ncbi:MAG: GAF domain-containing protein [Chloroflexi bacterium]|nr:GAF domain-containing protein [Chloroflexota bacterium]
MEINVALFVLQAAILGITAWMLFRFRRIFGNAERIEEELSRSNARLQRLNRVLRVASNIHQLIFREQNRSRLLQQACETLTDGQDYVFVWLGLLSSDGVTSNAVAASHPSDLDRFTFRLDDPERGPTCAAACIRSRAPFRIEPAPNADHCPSCVLRASNSSRSAVAVPLLQKGRAIGAVVVHAGRPNVFDDEEIALLQDVADDLVHAISMLSSIEYLRPALDIPYYHHERWNGAGYPFGLKGEAIPIAARIFAIADVWDAVTTDRPYRSGWPKNHAADYMRGQAGQLFDPLIVDVFLRMIEGQGA